MEIIHSTPQGWYDVPEDTYHGTQRLSSSGIKDILICPKYYYERNVLKGETKKATPAQVRGRAIHKALLEHDCSNLDDTSLHMVDSVLNDQTFKGQFQHGEAEKTGLFSVSDNTHCKIRCDYLIRQGATIVDLKTTSDISLKGIRRDIEKWEYGIQAAFYTFGASLIDNIKYEFVFVFVETSAPYRVQVINVSREIINRAYGKIHKAAQTYEECLLAGKWPKVQLPHETIKEWGED